VHITYLHTDRAVDWKALRADLALDGTHGGRSAAQLQQAFADSDCVCLAVLQRNVVGTARAVSDSANRAYIADVWTHPNLRRRGIATDMISQLLEHLTGQHVYLFSDPQWSALYARFGFFPHKSGLNNALDKQLLERRPP
jgi:predicted GNAT family acetyltransferase